MISFVYLDVTFNFASAIKVVLLSAIVLILFIVEDCHSRILFFLLCMLVKGACLIE